MRHITALAMILLVGCARQNEAVKVNVPDKAPIYYELNGAIVGTTNYLMTCNDWGQDWATVQDGNKCGGVHFIGRSWDLDSLSACRALSERLEKQRDELNEKIRKVG